MTAAAAVVEPDHAVRVVGLDLSWTGTGMADNCGRADVFKTEPGDYPSKRHRLQAIVDVVDMFVHVDECPALVVVEGPSFASKGRAVVDMGGLWWSVTQRLWGLGCVRLVECPPSVRAMYATGKGNAGKAAVVAAVARREPDLPIDSDDVVDAAVLRALGAAVLGSPLPGWAEVPATHLRAVQTLSGLLDDTPK